MDTVAEFAQQLRGTDQLAQIAIEPHHVARAFIALCTHAGPQKRQCRLADGRRDLIETEAVLAVIGDAIVPAVFFDGGKRQNNVCPLLGA